MKEVPHPPTSLPDPMDVVWCRFPYDERPGEPGVDAHPALVFETKEYKDGLYAVKVVYGTSNVKRPDGPHFMVSNVTKMMYAGLNKVTIFDLGRSKWLVWTDRWFISPDTRKYATPKIGCIKPDSQEVLAIILRKRAALGLPNP